MASIAGSPSGDRWGSTAADEPAFTRYYRTVRSHWRLILACVAVTLAAAIAYVALAPRTYTAQAQLLINPASTQDTVLFSLPVLHSSGDPTQDVLTAASLVTSPQIADLLIAREGLKTTPNQLLSHISATPLDQSDIVALQATASTPGAAQRLASAFAQAVVSVRTAALHRAIAAILPGLRTTVARLPTAQQSGPGTLGDQLNQLEQLLSSPDPTISVSAPPALPTSPTSPHKALSLAIGLLAGLLLGVGGAFAVDALDPRLRRESQLRDRFDSPILARIPDVPGVRKSGPLTPIELPFHALEQYRTVRAMLVARSSDHSQAFLLTGSAPAEGKTTSAVNLAAALAVGGDSVIMIEADLRRPTLAAAFGLHRFGSTEQVLRGDISLEDAIRRVRLGSSSMMVLAASGHRSEEADRLSPASAQQLVEEAKKLAQFVVIDSPPITAVVDALPFAKVADAVLVVARLGHSRLSKLTELWEVLGHQDTLPSGIIVVGAPERAHDKYGYGYYTPSDTGDWTPSGDPVGLGDSVLRPAAGKPRRS